MLDRTFIDSIVQMFERDLGKLTAELGKYQREENIWVTRGDIPNSAGNLCMHLCGNLQHYIGHGIGHSSYVRDRDREFAVKGLSKAELLKEVETTRRAVLDALQKMDPALLTVEYPLPVFDYAMTHVHFITHLLAHFSYHLGQINYHRRLIDVTAT